jgi:hypothetical protein
MCPPISAANIEKLYREARSHSLHDALASFGEAVTGVRGYLACNGFVVHGSVLGTEIFKGDGTRIQPTRLINCPDLVINHLGLSIARVSALEHYDVSSSLAIFAIRLGLLSRILDMAYAHLKDRVSFGQKTLKHQLVKATFADVHGAVLSLKEQICVRAARSCTVGLIDDHSMVTEFNSKAEKLMGGHGYLLTGTHSLSYLSMVLFSVYGTTL